MSAVLDFPVKPEARPYLDAFGRGDVREPDWLTRERRRALSRFAELGFPTRRSESWRYLDLQPLQQKPLLPAEAEPGEHDAAAHELLAGLELPGRGPRLVILDGLVAPELSDLDDLPAGVWFGAPRPLQAEGRAAARRHRNPIRVVPTRPDGRYAFAEVSVVTARRSSSVLAGVIRSTTASAMATLPSIHSARRGSSRTAASRRTDRRTAPLFGRLSQGTIAIGALAP